uniref:Uncharacterized protein n=1 Tax=Anguilla anguilla TaxID=7936 RepID=A0A0E9UQ15_ANGAN
MHWKGHHCQTRGSAGKHLEGNIIPRRAHLCQHDEPQAFTPYH